MNNLRNQCHLIVRVMPLKNWQALKFGKTGTAYITRDVGWNQGERVDTGNRKPDGTPIMEWKDGPTSWYQATWFGHEAEVVSQVHPGTLLFISGKIEKEYYEKKDGSGRGETTKITVDTTMFPIFSSKMIDVNEDGSILLKRGKAGEGGSRRQPVQPLGFEQEAFDESPF